MIDSPFVLDDILHPVRARRSKLETDRDGALSHSIASSSNGVPSLSSVALILSCALVGFKSVSQNKD